MYTYVYIYMNIYVNIYIYICTQELSSYLPTDIIHTHFTSILQRSHPTHIQHTPCVLFVGFLLLQ